VQISHPFEKLYKLYQPSLIHFARYLTHSEADAVEIVNDVFMAIWENKADFKLDQSLKPYLFTAVKNKCFNFNKKKKLQTYPDLPNDATSYFTADGSLLEQEQQNKLSRIMNKLPPKCKQVFAMSRIDELSYNEIAVLMDISVKTVEAQMSKALKIFRENLKIE
jgi:RNA polymerase sigma-70 factor (ECF subfamily)